MTDYRSMFDREYIGSWICRGPRRGGQDPRRQGRRPEQRQAEQQEADPLLRRKERRNGLHKTNAKTVASLYGNDVAGWIGKSIALYVATTRDPSGGGDVECIRVRPTAPKAEPVKGKREAAS